MDLPTRLIVKGSHWRFVFYGLLIAFAYTVVMLQLMQKQILGDVWQMIIKHREIPGPPKTGGASPTAEMIPGSALFHRQWDVNCSALFAGDDAVIEETAMFISREREQRNGSLPVPIDAEVRNWTRDCEAFRRERGYPMYPMSEEETSFPLAYTIITHMTAAQVERLLRAIYQPQNIYCFHPDAGSSAEFHGAIRGLANCFDNVFVASKLEDVQYAGFTRLLADINCMRDLTGPPAGGHPWKYLINLCGQDFPLKTNLEIVRQMRFYNGTNDIHSYPQSAYKRQWTYFHHTVRNGFVERTPIPKRPPPRGMRLHNGNAYFAATRQFIDFVLTDQRAIHLLDWTRDTYSPDEVYWATLQRLPGAPGGFPDIAANSDCKFRFVKWVSDLTTPECRFGKTVRVVCIFGVDYLQHLIRAPNLFANKFHYDFDPVTMQCLEERLYFRSTHPEESDQLDNFPLSNYIKQETINDLHTQPSLSVA
ncbi:beta-1,3-galactosyl-O-glycosyl-glycoprotein beta-1,6-N-acetylglucosaminyltransferase-like [Patiria miniata]|uniref:Beta-1,3-galactosyl-O-glycosyl-glycoprotein beta-1,6-N-acetylglucosaminyltransferase n=1 Tax=Patiria miniata TaxID=46514 RepID=A0A914ARX7_PATMI|nr:beta-1,3-galactosyl-O-glycosyl-glycoprotein beta-1,6-N-acetylglucosaminyltransferase-like [Patiria miniata]